MQEPRAREDPTEQRLQPAGRKGKQNPGDEPRRCRAVSREQLSHRTLKLTVPVIARSALK